MNTKTLMIAALAAFALAAVPSATAESPADASASETAETPHTIPCILTIQEVNVAGVVTIREVAVGSC